MNTETKTQYGWEITNVKNFAMAFAAGVVNLALTIINLSSSEPNTTIVQFAIIINLTAFVFGFVVAFNIFSQITTKQVPLTETDILKKR